MLGCFGGRWWIALNTFCLSMGHQPQRPSIYCSLGADSFCFPCKSVEVYKTLGRVMYFSRNIQPEDVRFRGLYPRIQLRNCHIFTSAGDSYFHLENNHLLFICISMSPLRVISRETIAGKLSGCMYFL